MGVDSSHRKTVLGACPKDCPDTCAMLYTVEDGRLVDVKGNPDSPMTRGGLCVKLKDFARHHYSPDRVLYPLKRVGPKGGGHFERISWEEALATIRSRWTGIIEEHGAEAIYPHIYAGQEGVLHGTLCGDAFFNRLGATIAERTYCASGSMTAQEMVIGPSGGLDPESIAHAKYILIWGMNVVSTNLHLWHFVHEAQKKGARVVVIDPAKSRTAKMADWHVACRPATDGALALALIHVIVAEGLVDADYVDRHTVGFEALAERAAAFSPEVAEGITGVPAADIRQLAREFATSQPAAIRLGISVERHRGGPDAIRAITCLPALVGAWRHVGGGLLHLPLYEFPLFLDRISRPDWIRPGTRVLNAIELGRWLTEDPSPPIRSLFVCNSNPLSQGTDQNRLREGLMREDLFTVVSELVITDTARYADIVLPATMQAEQLDLMYSWGHFYFTMNLPAIDSPGEAVPNTELFRRLASTMGFTDPEWQRSDEQMLLDFVDWSSPKMQGITLATLKEKGFERLRIDAPDRRAPHADGNFPTPSGKCEFVSSMAAKGNVVNPVWRQMYAGAQPGQAVDPVPDFLPPYESPASNPALAEKYPLNIVSPKPHALLSSQMGNDPIQLERQGEQLIVVHPDDARSRGIASGSFVRVWNARGAFEGKALVSDDVMRGVLFTNIGYWLGLSRNGNAANAVTSDRYGGLANTAMFSDALVEVALVEVASATAVPVDVPAARPATAAP